MLSAKLDPHVVRYLEAAKALGRPPLHTLEPAAARQQVLNSIDSDWGTPEPVREVKNLRIEGPGGDIPLRIYAAGYGAARPGLVYFHGGGWVLCDLDTHDVICRAVANRAG